MKWLGGRPLALGRRGDVGRWVTPEELNVAPALLGQPLAAPWRRLLAMAADLAAIGIVSSLSNFWLLAGCALGAFEQARARRRAPSLARIVGVWGLAVVMAGAGLYGVIEELGQERPARSAPDDDDDGDEDLDDTDALVNSLLAPAAASAPDAAASLAPSVVTLEAEVRRLKRQLARERQVAEDAAAAEHWRERLRRLGLEFGIGYGWALVYFTMLPVWWQGQTVGKRLFGLRIVEITGKPMVPLLAFKRFGGYLAGMATGGLGLLQLLWDPNRQALQDKAAHTVVIDERLPRRPQPADGAPLAPAPLPTVEDGTAKPAPDAADLALEPPTAS
jgi:hypothetical protein